MRNHLVVVVLIALLGATAAASANTPPGFTRAPRLEPAATLVAGKPARVWCARTKAAFEAAAAESTGNVDAAGFAVVGSQDEYLPPIGCAALLAWMNHRHVEDYTFAAAALVIAHEAMHLHGLSDEGQTDCAALAKLPNMIRRFFPVKGHDINLATVMAYAHDVHEREGPNYQGDC